MEQTSVAGSMKRRVKYDTEHDLNQAAESGVEYLSKDEWKNHLGKVRVAMEGAAKELDFIEAARLRDAMKNIELQINSKP